MRTRGRTVRVSTGRGAYSAQVTTLSPGKVSMGFKGSYLWKVRQHVGHDLVLMPSAMVLVVDVHDRMLLLRRTDDGEWCIPGGGAEEGSSFVETALAELGEETGIEVSADRLTPFASMSEASNHTLTYPNGDVTHYFAMVFVLTGWDSVAGQVVRDDESTAHGFFYRSELPEPLAEPAELALGLYDKFCSTGEFQAR